MTLSCPPTMAATRRRCASVSWRRGPQLGVIQAGTQRRRGLRVRAAVVMVVVMVVAAVRGECCVGAVQVKRAAEAVRCPPCSNHIRSPPRGACIGASALTRAGATGACPTTLPQLQSSSPACSPAWLPWYCPTPLNSPHVALTTPTQQLGLVACSPACLAWCCPTSLNPHPSHPAPPCLVI